MTKHKFSKVKIRDFQQISGLSYIIFIGLCLIGLCSTPAMAGTKYLSGEPDLSITIAGLNEFTPGTTIELPVLIENSGLNHMKMVQSGIVDRDDIPSTAKMVRVTLLPDGAPILVKSDTQMIGTLQVLKPSRSSSDQG